MTSNLLWIFNRSVRGTVLVICSTECIHSFILISSFNEGDPLPLYFCWNSHQLSHTEPGTVTSSSSSCCLVTIILHRDLWDFVVDLTMTSFDFAFLAIRKLLLPFYLVHMGAKTFPRLFSVFISVSFYIFSWFLVISLLWLRVFTHGGDKGEKDTQQLQQHQNLWALRSVTKIQ